MIPRQEWNDTINNYRYPLGEFDFRRMLFVRDRLYGPTEFQKLFKFVIVRNPFDRALSCWRYRMAQGLKRDSVTGSFERFLEGLSENWKSKRNRHMAMHTAPVWPDITDDSGVLLVDRIYHLEEIQMGLPEICSFLGVKERVLLRKNSLSRINCYREFYSDYGRSLVERIYGDDLERLGYKF